MQTLEDSFKGKEMPKYAEEFLEWHQRKTKLKRVSKRNRVYPEAKKKANKCPEGCQNITRHGSNQHYQKWTCLDCGFGDCAKVLTKKSTKGEAPRR